MILNFVKQSGRLGQIMRYASPVPGNGNTSMSTIDPNEVSKFGSHMKFWWDPNGPMRALFKMNHIRKYICTGEFYTVNNRKCLIQMQNFPFIQDGLNNVGKLNAISVNSSFPLKDLNILDVGCGGGYLSERLAYLGANVTGIDANEELIHVAKLHSLQNQELKNEISYIHAPLEDKCNELKNHFDVVVASEIIEHVASKEIFLKSCTDVLKPGGSIFLTTFNKTMISWLYGIILLEYLTQEIPIGTHEWDKFVPPQEAATILKEYNCTIHNVRGLIYSYAGHIWKWRQSNSIWYALHAVKEL